MKQSRLQSKPFWVAVVALVAFVLGNWGLYDAIGLTSESFKTLTDLLFSVAVAVGIFNNPNDAENW